MEIRRVQYTIWPLKQTKQGSGRFCVQGQRHFVALKAPARRVAKAGQIDQFREQAQQLVARLVYERMAARPSKIYGEGVASNYQGQGLKLSKHFR